MKFVLSAIKGLEPGFYFRHLFFSALAFLWFLNNLFHSNSGVDLANVIFLLLNFVLYPYAHYAVETGIRFIKGDKTFLFNMIGYFFLKFVQFLITWCAAIVIAPVGLVFLGLKAYRADRQAENI